MPPILSFAAVRDSVASVDSATIHLSCTVRTELKFGTHLRTPALKTENFSKNIGRFSKTQKRIY